MRILSFLAGGGDAVSGLEGVMMGCNADWNDLPM